MSTTLNPIGKLSCTLGSYRTVRFTNVEPTEDAVKKTVTLDSAVKLRGRPSEHVVAGRYQEALDMLYSHRAEEFGLVGLIHDLRRAVRIRMKPEKIVDLLQVEYVFGDTVPVCVVEGQR